MIQAPPTLLVTRRQAALTSRFLIPAKAEIEASLLAIRAELDASFGVSTPQIYGKPYPQGFCLEITREVMALLRKRLERPVSPGERAIKAFLQNGGEGRRVWGVLREQFFQNAMQFGGLYIDVANDSVDINKPKVEILPMEESGFVLVRGPAHYAAIAERYWGARLYANHALPSLAPMFPLICVNKRGVAGLHSRNGYMTDQACDTGFKLSEAWLIEGPPPPPEVVEALRSACPERVLARDPVIGEAAAVAACRERRGARVSLGWKKDMWARFEQASPIPVPGWG